MAKSLESDVGEQADIAAGQQHLVFGERDRIANVIVEQVVALESAEKAVLALGILTAELDEFVKAHAVAMQ